MEQKSVVISNEDRYSLYRKKKILKYLLLFLSLCVVVLEVLALFKIVHYIWGLVVFLVVYLIKKVFVKTNEKEI